MKQASNETGPDALPTGTNGDAKPSLTFFHVEKIEPSEVPPARKEFYDEVLFQDPRFRERRESGEHDDQPNASRE